MRKRTLLFALWAACGAQAAVTANWAFDDDVATNTAATLVTEVNAPALNGTAVQNAGGPKPTFSDDRPGARIWASSDGPLLNTTNSASLRFVNTGLGTTLDSHVGGAVNVPDNDPLLRATNLTVEAFVKVDRRVNFPLLVGKARSSGTSWNLDFDNAGKPRVRIDSGVAFTNGTPGFNQSWTASVSIEDGQWHHVAFTYAHTNKAVTVYVDYIQRASGNSYSNLVYDAGALRIGQGAGARAFDGWIDEIRITDEVLAPAQFMTVTEPSSTRIYLPFEDGPDGTFANVLTNTFYAPLLHATAGTVAGAGTPVKPAFSSDRPPASTARIADGEDGPLINVVNSGSLFFVNAGLPADTNSMAGGVVTLPGSPLPAQLTNFTAEVFLKVNRHVNYPQLIGKLRAATGGLSWGLDIDNLGQLRARFDTQIPPGTDGNNQGFNTTAFLEDGRWHHVALTYDHPSRTLRLYMDYELVRQGQTTNPISSDSGSFQIGGGGGAVRCFDGWIDEVRLTDRVLAPAEFLRTVPLFGTLISLQ